MLKYIVTPLGLTNVGEYERRIATDLAEVVAVLEKDVRLVSPVN